MQKSRFILLACLAIALFASNWATMAHAVLSPGIYVTPGTISSPGQPTNITLVTATAATGTLTVTAPDGTTHWTAVIATVGPSYTQIWSFPADLSGNTNQVGKYDVTADVTMFIGTFTWRTSFEVQFFVVPDLPFGTLMAVVACFGAFIGYKKLKP